MSEFRSQKSEVNARKPARSFKELLVWQKARALTLRIYTLTENFPRKELFGITAQFRRAGVSAPSNIAEGFKRRTRPDKARFLNIAQGSLEEARYLTILSRDLKYLKTDLEPEIEEAARLLGAYVERVLNSEF